VLGMTRLLASGLEGVGLALLRALLVLQLLVLACFLALCVAAGPDIDPNAIIAGMLGVAAMVVQNALVRISLQGAPATAAMLGRNPHEITSACNRAKHAWPAIVGFAAGCGLGAVCEAVFGLQSLELPGGFARMALALGLSVKQDAGGC
jgi:uncharacterized membrane protein YoaK (UPF0700 family)